MRALAIHTCPLWEYEHGQRYPGLGPSPSATATVGWINVMAVEIAGDAHLLLLTKDA